MYKEYLKKIRKFYKANKRMPSFSEVLSITGLKSKNAVSKFVDKMSDLGLISRDDRGKLIPGNSFFSIPKLGMVEAGFPSPAEEELSDTISLDDYLINNKEATFILTIKGESMIDAGIMEGDMALVEKGVTPKDRDIVIAEVDGAWTIKYYRKVGGSVYLEPANAKFQPIYPKENLRVGAVVRAVIRKY